MIMREATPEERRHFYAEEWNKRDLPDFILHTLSLREFGFDYDGTGPSHRYNQFMTVEQLGDFLRNKAPYAAYASVALYERPTFRKGWLKSELVFDVDAKDLPLKTCGCPKGSVCEKCLDDARSIAISLAETMRTDLNFRNIHFVFSGRGFHVRVTDEGVMGMEQTERSQIVRYLTGGTIPSDITLALGYSRVFRERAAHAFTRLSEEQLMQVPHMRGALARRLLEKKQRVFESIRGGYLSEFEGMGEKTLNGMLEFLARTNLAITDGEVTVDTKRILRLPSSLHSGVSMKCTVVRDIERFSIDEAIPKFVRERGG